MVIKISENSGKVCAVYAAYGAGIDVANEPVTLAAGVESLANTNVLVSKVTSDGAGANPITKAWYCTVQGELHVTNGGDVIVYVTYKYWNVKTYVKVTGDDIAFVDGGEGEDTITSVAEAFGDFTTGDIILISGSTSNDGTYTLTAAAAGTLTVATGLLTTEAAGETVTIQTTSLIAQVAGFFSWSFNRVGDPLEATDYSDAGHRTYIPGVDSWTGSAERHWLTELPLEWENTKLIIKFYVDVDSAIRFEGWGLVTGHGVTSAVDTLVNESISFQGDGILSYESS